MVVIHLVTVGTHGAPPSRSSVCPFDRPTRPTVREPVLETSCYPETLKSCASCVPSVRCGRGAAATKTKPWMWPCTCDAATCELVDGNCSERHHHDHVMVWLICYCSCCRRCCSGWEYCTNRGTTTRTRTNVVCVARGAPVFFLYRSALKGEER